MLAIGPRRRFYWGPDEHSQPDEFARDLLVVFIPWTIDGSLSPGCAIPRASEVVANWCITNLEFIKRACDGRVIRDYTGNTQPIC